MKPFELLLVEDDPGDILLIHQTLARESVPISLHVAVSGDQAVQMLNARQFEPDLIILDLNIPKIPGLTVLESTEPEVPVVVFTSSSNPRERQRAFDLGAKEFIQKPMDLTEYSETVSQIFRRWRFVVNNPETS